MLYLPANESAADAMIAPQLLEFGVFDTTGSSLREFAWC